ncbi:protein of unknown function [Paraburkholderia kururiensis]
MQARNKKGAKPEAILAQRLRRRRRVLARVDGLACGARHARVALRSSKSQRGCGHIESHAVCMAARKFPMRRVCSGGSFSGRIVRN